MIFEIYSKTVCYYHVTYEFQSESKLYSLPEFQGTSSLNQRVDRRFTTIECRLTLKLVRYMITTYWKMHCTEKYAQQSSIIWLVSLNG